MHKNISLVAIFITVFLAFNWHAQAENWRILSISGDNDIPAFDNSVRDFVGKAGTKKNVSAVKLFAHKDSIARKSGDRLSNAQNILAAFGRKKAGRGDGCLIYMTSHGIQNKGFYLANGPAYIPPDSLNAQIDRMCGNVPTVMLISACYSGQFITDATKKQNRIILTSARSDRPSFGCAAGEKYPYWDECVITAVGDTATWEELYERVNVCVTKKEDELFASASSEHRSEPQAFFGAKMRNIKILN